MSDDSGDQRPPGGGTADELGWADGVVGDESWADAHLGGVDDGSTPASDPEPPPHDNRPTGEVELPHWTDPPTGEVPAVIAGSPPPGAGDDLEAWSFTSSRPRWRDEHTEDHQIDSFEDLAPTEPEVGDEEAAEDFFTFDDLDRDPVPIGGDGPAVAASPSGAPDQRRREPRTQRSAAVSATGAGRDLPAAAGVGLGLLGLGILAFWYADWSAVALVTVVLALACGEYLGALRRGGFAPATLPGLAAAATLPLAAYNFGTQAYPIVLSLLVLVGLCWFLFGVQRDQPVMNLGVTLVAVGHVGVLGSFAALLIRHYPDGGGAQMVFAGVIATVAYDVGAYFIGRSAGRTPLTAASPNKTVEGLVGGMAMSVLVSVVVIGVLDISDFGVLGSSVWRAVLLGVVVSIAAPIGDLCESLVKRDLDVKDMGSLLPGHGGVMDRFDSLLFVLPTVYYLVTFLEPA